MKNNEATKQCYYQVLLCVVGSATFFRSHFQCVYYLHSRIICYLPTTEWFCLIHLFYLHLFSHISLFYLFVIQFTQRQNLIIFYISQLFPSNVLISPWILYFFLLSLPWGQSCRQCFTVSIWFLHAAFRQVGGFSFLDIKCP